MKILNTTVELEVHLRNQLHGSSVPMLVSFDGFSGAGKTPLTKELAECLQVSHVHLDEFYVKDSHFVGSFQFERFHQVLGDSIKIGHTFVEGMLIDDVLAHSGFTPKLKIYVKRVSRLGWWYDGSNLDNNGQPATQGRFLATLIEYHERMKPHETADIIINLVEGTA